MPAGLLPAVLAVPLMLPGVATGIGPPATSVAASGSWTAVEPRSPGTTNNDLTGVAVLSPGNAWAVGTYADEAGGQTLIERWNGTAWSVVHSPDPGGGGDFLSAVTAVSAASTWAVGEYDGAEGNTLILHWDGATWTTQTSPNPGTGGDLSGIAASSAASAWAVGQFGAAGGEAAFALHCCVSTSPRA